MSETGNLDNTRARLGDAGELVTTIRDIINNTGSGTYPALGRLISPLFAAVRSGAYKNIEKEDAKKIIRLFSGFRCADFAAEKYGVGILALALRAQELPLLALMYCVARRSEDNEALFADAAGYVMSAGLGYSSRLGDLRRTYEYLVTGEEPEVILSALEKASYVLRARLGEDPYQHFGRDELERVEPTTLASVLIADYAGEQSWKMLAKYSSKLNKWALNFAANAIWMYKFRYDTHPVTNCTRALRENTESCLSRNFLSLSLTCLERGSDRPLGDFFHALIGHVIKYASFKTAPAELISRYYKYLGAHDSVRAFNLATIIAKQTGSFGEMIAAFFDGKDGVPNYVDVGALVRLSVAFVGSADSDCFNSLLSTVLSLRDRMNEWGVTPRDRRALAWVDDMIARRLERGRDRFIDASATLLATYPEEPDRIENNKYLRLSSEDKLPDYDFVKNWISIYGGMPLVNSVEYYLEKSPDPSWNDGEDEQRARYFKLKLLLAEHYVLYFREEFSRVGEDSARRVRTCYVLKTIVGDTTPIPSELLRKMESMHDVGAEHEAYDEFRHVIDDFAARVDDVQIRNMLLYSATTNYWDLCLEGLLDMPERVAPYVGELNRLCTVMDYRPLCRRLLQMLAYPTVANAWAKDEGMDRGELVRHKEIHKYYRNIVSGELDAPSYIEDTCRLVEIMRPELGAIAGKLSAESPDAYEYALGVVYALKRKHPDVLRRDLATYEGESLEGAIIPTVCAIQYPEDTAKLVCDLVYDGVDVASSFLEHSDVKGVIGDSLTHLFRAVHHVKAGEMDAASSDLSAAGDVPESYRDVYLGVKASLETGAELAPRNTSEARSRALGSFSFARRADAGAEELSRLVMDFYSENLHDAAGKCEIAARIYSLLLDGEEYRDARKLMIDWGFLEIDATFDVEKKASILFELAKSIESSGYVAQSKYKFIERFVYLLNEFDYTLLIKRFGEISECHRTIYAKYAPYDNCECYAQALDLVGRLLALGGSQVDPERVMPEIKEIESQLLGLHLKYPQNRFASKCIDLADRFAKQLLEQGIFEVRILNEGARFSGTVYYSIRNIGYEPVRDVSLTFAVDGYPASAERVEIGAVIPEGLRPGQAYAGEYSPSVSPKIGETVGCTVSVRYPMGEDGGEYKSYVAIDPRTGGTLTVSAPDATVYRKDGGAGYIEESIKHSSGFIGREAELGRIMGKILRGQNVLLYGTNGTGKSSILNNIRTVHLPKAYGEEKKYYATGLITFDVCTERNVLETIVSSVSDTTLFRAFLRRATEESRDIISFATDEWHESVREIFDAEGRCVNTSAVHRYFEALDEALAISDLDVYILIDQFERVISSPDIDSRHMLFLRDLKCERIRFILAGSNWLLEEIAVDRINGADDSSWSDIFSRGFAAKEKIGNMSRGDFEKLMTQPVALNGGALRYSPEALEYLWQFTNGHAFYSCLIGNRTLEILSKREVKRCVIYPSDIFAAIYQPGKYLPTEVSNMEKETAIKDQIFQDIEDNNPVKCVGQALAMIQSRGERRVSYDKLKEWIEEHRPDVVADIADSLAVLTARDFISYGEIDWHKRSGDEKQYEAREYFFTSDLYLEHFAKVHIDQLSEEEIVLLASKNRSIEAIEGELRNLTYDQIEDLKERLPGMFKIEKTINMERGAKYVEGDDRSINYTARNMNMIVAQTADAVMALSGLINDARSGKAIGEGQVSDSIGAMPRLELLPAGSADYVEGDEFSKYDTDKYCDAVEKGVYQAVEKSSGRSILEWANDRKDKLEELGVTDLEYVLERDEQEKNAILVALYLRCMFDEVTELSSIAMDYAPVTIMMCKTIERILNQKHLPIYHDRTVWKYEVRSYNDKMPSKSDRITFQAPGKATIGTFTTALFAMFRISENDPERKEKEEIRDIFLTRTEANENQWRNYLYCLNSAQKLRNNTAHIEVVTEADCNEFFKNFFERKLLKHTHDYVV